ncbi:GNAT family N-acetyltransferase [Massilia sp. IC2-477]|uniref:GNAT family N-acetyltransferase n=1 Tax=unclassified Massilia TaxID=2609279 RepID=UPI001D0F5785|nr:MULTISPECIES: GNAT family N-acetyltransferase [unclassified Massilia]MCC2954400.1 GNAT family N-acetyltransferase [Massilia sp. IC2-477]MCC2971824.1 GNAT family N-acetyltransferase [Massilia sp. IC2-476]
MIIRRLDARAIGEVRTQLATLLLDAVADGFSLGFLAGLDDQQLDAYWSGVAADVARGSRVLLAAERNGLLVGTVQLDLCQKPNGSNRAEVQNMLVHCTMRRRGVGYALLEAAEVEALALRRGLLFLDTEAGSGAEQLYQKAGYTRVGELPDYCCSPNGHWRATAIYYKTLFSRARR